MFEAKVTEKDLKYILDELGYNVKLYGSGISPLISKKPGKRDEDIDIKTEARCGYEYAKETLNEIRALYKALGYKYEEGGVAKKLK